MRGYQFSESDRNLPDVAPLYASLSENYQAFRSILAAVGFTLCRHHDVIFLEDEAKTLSKEDKRTIVVLFLLVDLWLEKGKPYADLFQISVPWRDLEWFRDGYGREYLAQVDIEVGDIATIDELLYRLDRKGLVSYSRETDTLRLRRPAERLINAARRIHSDVRDTDDA
jgi:hypothetical protein